MRVREVSSQGPTATAKVYDHTVHARGQHELRGVLVRILLEPHRAAKNASSQ